MPEIEVNISGGIFLFSLTYWSNCCMTARRKASISLDLVRDLAVGSSITSMGVIVATKWVSLSSTLLTNARCTPSTSTLTVPSGSLSICRMVEIQPTLNRSVTIGSSLAAAFCATSMMRRSAAMATSSDLMLLGLPTNSGMTMCGNTTTSRSGNSGKSDDVTVKVGSSDINHPFVSRCGMVVPTCRAMAPLSRGKTQSMTAKPRQRQIKSGFFGSFVIDQQRALVFVNGGFIKNHLLDVGQVGQVKHRVNQRLLQNRTQAACTGFSR
ncbi:hypothetical protein GALL_463250 [mine drainage metagenome]|uniref:Uncharacterized protein n=1 Tax=mine drainage metagenome TaxID=410659 RepID=A0A1J5PKJ9_9ZZZZ